eukprot:gnl/MRDRNA2_/MRDRNA2_89673_c0_seq1.p1 gnl/MRDRNA2_/MRDRNA2_89673_c0~~gnl/MRDRNA2_/MRDRNA2_89673_c0_seq1.p1  ORF type:complete len:375 (-),score=81.82 gnl/MRDRNA2_/MRDRNA2_89673_c0_seq1:34-1098(-)
MTDEEQPLLAKQKPQQKTSPWVRRAIMGVIILAWFVAGIWVGCKIEGWSFITAVYVMVQIITTIGYGDILLDHQSMKFFIAIYVLLGVLVLAGMVTNMAEDVLSKQEEVLERQFKRLAARITGDSDVPPTDTQKAVTRLAISFTLFLFFLAAGTIFFATYEQCSCSYGRTAIEGCEEFKETPVPFADSDDGLHVVKEGVDKLNIVKDFDKCVATGGQVKTWIDSFYMSMVTLTTVGFGDHSPKSYYGRWFSVFWMLFGVVATGNFIGAASEFIMARQQDTRRIETISDDVFAKIDFDKDGCISRAEFRSYGFLHFHIVSDEDMNRIDAIFEGIDADKNGYLTYEECQQYFGASK